MSLDNGIIQPNQITDTISLTITVPAETLSMGFVFDLRAVTDQDAISTLEISYVAVGVNKARAPQYPDRTSTFTKQMTGVIDRVSELLQLFIYDPIPYEAPDPNSRKMNLFTDTDLCVRLDPTNHVQGYTVVEDRLRASFQGESREIVTTFDAFLTQTMTYATSGSLVIPAAEEMVREWRLFWPAVGNDAEQHKRTVLVISRQGELYSIENIVPKYRADTLSHFSADLLQVHKRDMGSPDFWNPWARTYRFEVDKPYKQYVCPFELEELLVDLGSSSAGSNASMGSNLLGSDVS